MRSRDPRDAPPPSDEVLYCLPMVPLPNIRTSVGKALYRKLHAFKKPASEAHWTESELRLICGQLAIPVPRHLQTKEERAAADACPF